MKYSNSKKYKKTTQKNIKRKLYKITKTGMENLTLTKN